MENVDTLFKGQSAPEDGVAALESFVGGLGGVFSGHFVLPACPA